MQGLPRGSNRDNRVTSLVESCGALDSDQVRLLLFRSLKSGERVCQRRLQALTEAGRLNRTRMSIDQPYVYYTTKRAPKQMDHLLAVNWVRAWFSVGIGTRDTLRWDYEVDHKVLRCDAFVGIKDGHLGSSLKAENKKRAWRFWFVEVDRSQNTFDKVRKYNDLYEKDGYLSTWWSPFAQGFPTVLCVTEDPARKKMIEQSVRDDNPKGLEFQVRLLDDIRKEALAK